MASAHNHGEETGAANVASSSARRSLERNANQSTEHEAHVILDGAWKNEEAPSLCRFTDGSSPTKGEMTFNLVISEQRVSCENHCEKTHGSFRMLKHFRQR